LELQYVGYEQKNVTVEAANQSAISVPLVEMTGQLTGEIQVIEVNNDSAYRSFRMNHLLRKEKK
jgi:hypothetical protein